MNICTTCGYVGDPTKHTKGSLGVELLLWLFFIIPGLIYSVWRLSSRHDVCPACKNPTLIPVSTPKGQELLEAAQQKNPELVAAASTKETNANHVKLVLLAIVIMVGVVVIYQILKF